MRVRLTLVAVILLAAGCGGSKPKPPPPPPPPPPPATPPSSVKLPAGEAKLVAPGHTAKANTKWRYRVELRKSSGEPLPGRVTVQIVDPLGRAHAATYDDTKQPIVRRPFRGTFADYLEFPTDARGFTLTVRVIVATAKGRGKIDYPVAPQ